MTAGRSWRKESFSTGWPAIRYDSLPINQAILFDGEYSTWALWNSLDLIVDGITDPGNIKVTVNAWIDLSVRREASIVLVDQA